jgi:hypothetical protein
MQTCSEPGCGRPSVKATGRCAEHGKKRPPSAASGPATLTMELPEEIIDWLYSRPEGPASFVQAAVRQVMQHDPHSVVTEAIREFNRVHEAELARGIVASLTQGGTSSPAPATPAATASQPQSPAPSDECQILLQQIEARDPDAARRAAALTRYPQLVEAVARDLVSIVRAEEMAAEADSRSRR